MKKRKSHLGEFKKRIRVGSNAFVFVGVLFVAGVLFLGLLVKVSGDRSIAVKSATFSLSTPYSLGSAMILSLGVTNRSPLTDKSVSLVEVEIANSVYPCEGVVFKKDGNQNTISCSVKYSGKKFTSFVVRVMDEKGNITYQDLVKGADPRAVSLVLVRTASSSSSLYLGVKSLYFFKRCSLMNASSMKVLTEMQSHNVSNPLLPLETLSKNEGSDVFARCYIGSSYVDTEAVSLGSLL